MEKISPLTLKETQERLSVSIGADWLFIAELLETGKAEAFELMGCNFITCFEQERENKFLVLMCAEGENLKAACKQIAEMAKEQNCNKVRFFTKRKALTRMINFFNWEEKETIYEADL